VRVKLLGLETSSARGSVALLAEHELLERTIATPREQTEKLLDLVQDLMSEAGYGLSDLHGIAFGRGPGSFTGLRVAAAIAQGYAFSTGVPLFPVSSLATLAQGAWRTAAVEHSLIAIDARMGEIYCGEFVVVGGLAQPQRPEALVEPGLLRAPSGAAFTALGNGFAAYPDALAAVAARADRVCGGLEPLARDLFPLAAADLAAGRSTPLEVALPVYLREHSAWRR
jgi:tRNA threonylcarbamoyladenosine biosynthesis protein TsaB